MGCLAPGQVNVKGDVCGLPPASLGLGSGLTQKTLAHVIRQQKFLGGSVFLFHLRIVPYTLLISWFLVPRRALSLRRLFCCAGK
ncbi:MAG: hypothetical protein C5B47_00325 [Verrucomicrobia bacterium]|nr:MAG: hypothetical protein C5B47_00325 [Verrucomicrobiota bacterium]